MSHREYKWFHGANVAKKQSISLHAIATSRLDTLQRIKQDPSCLFHVANTYYRPGVDEPMCSCCSDTSGDVVNETFLDLLIQYKTIREQDIVDMIDLDWFKLSPLLPLSMSTLEKYSEKVDWAGISASHLYNKTETFIRMWSKRLDWRCMTKVNIDSKLLARLVFEEAIIPLEYGLKHLKSRDALKYIDRVLDMSNGSPDVIMAFIERHGIACIDDGSIDNDEIFRDFKAALIWESNSQKFANMCCFQKYIPQSAFLKNVLKLAYADGNWTAFLKRCKPDVDFIVEHIINEKTTSETWACIADRKLSEDFISTYWSKMDPMIVMRHNQLESETLRAIFKTCSDAVLEESSKSARLSPEIIDEFAEQLDWYHLCEHQVLPEWLMNKYIEKLNWGQVSWYQKMSSEFIVAHLRFLNPIKLAANKTL